MSEIVNDSRSRIKGKENTEKLFRNRIFLFYYCVWPHVTYLIFLLFSDLGCLLLRYDKMHVCSHVRLLFPRPSISQFPCITNLDRCKLFNYLRYLNYLNQNLFVLIRLTVLTVLFSCFSSFRLASQLTRQF